MYFRLSTSQIWSVYITHHHYFYFYYLQIWSVYFILSTPQIRSVYFTLLPLPSNPVCVFHTLIPQIRFCFSQNFTFTWQLLLSQMTSIYFISHCTTSPVALTNITVTVIIMTSTNITTQSLVIHLSPSDPCIPFPQNQTTLATPLRRARLDNQLNNTAPAKGQARRRSHLYI